MSHVPIPQTLGVGIGNEVLTHPLPPKRSAGLRPLRGRPAPFPRKGRRQPLGRLRILEATRLLHFE